VSTYNINLTGYKRTLAITLTIISHALKSMCLATEPPTTPALNHPPYLPLLQVLRTCGVLGGAVKAEAQAGQRLQPCPSPLPPSLPPAQPPLQLEEAGSDAVNVTIISITNAYPYILGHTY